MGGKLRCKGHSAKYLKNKKKRGGVNKALCAVSFPRYLTSVYLTCNDRLPKRGQIYNIIRSFFISSLHPSHTLTHTHHHRLPHRI